MGYRGAAGTNTPNNLNFSVTNPLGVVTISDAIADDHTGGSGFTPVGINFTGPGQLNIPNANTYAGNTTLNSGIVGIGNVASLGTGNINMLGTSTLQALTNLSISNVINVTGTPSIDTLANAVTIPNTITGTGGLIKKGTGTLTLPVNNTFTGATTVTEGTIVYGTFGSFGGNIDLNLSGNSGGSIPTLTPSATGINIPQNINIGGSLNIGAILTNAGITTSVLAPISGGALSKTGDGTLILTFGSSYTGGTAINGGVLQISSGTQIGTGVVSMASGTTLRVAVGTTIGNNFNLAGSATIDPQATTTTLGGVVSGSGSLNKIGTGTLNLSGPNTYMGGTNVTAGVVGIAASTSLGLGNVAMASGTTLQSNANNLSVANAFNLTGNVTFNTQANTTSIGGTISGAGALFKSGTGILNLSGANTYTGNTSLNAGTIGLGNSNALGTGSVSMATNTGLQATADNLSVANGINIAGASTIDTQANTTNLTGVINGAGSITKTGTGTLNLAGANTYTGNTSLNAGTLGLGNSSALGTGNLTMANATTVQANLNNLVVGNLVNLTGSATVNTQANNASLTGVISGSGPLNKTGTGTLSLLGANSFTGSTTINQGTVAFNSNASFGNSPSIVMSGNVGTNPAIAATTTGLNLSKNISIIGTQNVGEILTNPGITTTVSGIISGGALSKTGDGSLILSAANTYTAGTAINAGTIETTNTSALGTGLVSMATATTLRLNAGNQSVANAVNLAGNAAIDILTNNVTLSNTVSGAGSLNKVGAGNLTLAGNNTYTGGTNITAGTVTTTSSGLGTGPVINNASLVFDQTTTGSFGGAISGAGTVQKQGTGTVVLTGVNSYSGGTQVTAGSLIGDTNSLQGAITNNATVGFNQAFDGTYAGTLSGTGTLNFTNTGKVQFTGNSSTFTGTTNVGAGNFNINGVLGGDLFVNNGAILSGNGTLNNVTNSGTVKPGNSIGTLTVTNFTNNADGVVEFEVAPNGAADLINASGTVTLNGGEAQVVALPGVYAAGTTYTLINAAGGLVGQFANSIIPPSLQAALNYLPNSLILTILKSGFSTQGLSGNALAVGNYISQNLDTLDDNPDFVNVLSALSTLNTSQLNKALNQLDAVPYQAISITAADAANLITTSFSERLNFLRRSNLCKPCDPCATGSGSGVWATGVADFIRQNHVDGLVGFNTSSQGIAFGLDNQVCDSMVAGLGGGYTHTNLHWHNSYGRTDINSFYVGAYASKYNDKFYVDGAVLGFVDHNRARRHIEFAAIDEKAKSSYYSYGFNPHLGAGLFLNYCTVDVIPFFNVDYFLVQQNRVREHGASSLDLHVKRNQANIMRVETGLNISKCYEICGGTFQPNASISWVGHRIFSGDKFISSFGGLSSSFAAYGTKYCFNQLELGAGATYYLNNKLALNGRYSIELGKRRQEQNVNLELNYNF
jgi:autotransporter-associated beta strand protein